MATKTISVHFDQRIGMVLCTVKQKGKKVPMGDAFAKTKEEAQSRAFNIANVCNFGDGTGVARRFGRDESESVSIEGSLPLYL